MKKSLISMTARSAVVVGIIIFLGHGGLDLRYIVLIMTVYAAYITVKVKNFYRCAREYEKNCKMPIKLRYRCKEDAEDLARKLLKGVEIGDIECHFMADYSQLSGYMVLNSYSQEAKINTATTGLGSISRLSELNQGNHENLSDGRFVSQCNRVFQKTQEPLPMGFQGNENRLTNDSYVVRPKENGENCYDIGGLGVNQKFQTNIVSLQKGGSILEIDVPVEARINVSENNMDLFLKDVCEAERINCKKGVK